MEKVFKIKRTLVHGTKYAEKAFILIGIITIVCLILKAILKITPETDSEIYLYFMMLSVYIVIIQLIMAGIQFIYYSYLVIPGIKFGNSRKNIFLGMECANLILVVQTIICTILLANQYKTEIVLGVVVYVFIINQGIQFMCLVKERFGLIPMTIFMTVGLVGFMMLIFAVLLIEFQVPKPIGFIFSSLLSMEFTGLFFVIMLWIINLFFNYRLIMKYEIKG